LTTDNVKQVSGTIPLNGTNNFYYMWDDAGLYVFADIQDITTTTPIAAGAGSYNSGDGIQVCIYADPTNEGANHGKLYFFSLIPAADDGKPYIGEHFVFGTDSAGADVPTAQIAAVKDGTKYTIEALIQKEAFTGSDPVITIQAGTVLPLASIIMEHDGTEQALFTDTAWFSGVNSNKYTLSPDATAGHTEIVEEVEAPTASVDTTATADAASAAPVTNAPSDAAKAPQTSDSDIYAMIVLLIAATAVSAFVISKRNLRRNVR
jgi:hypothetical protein